MFHNNSSVFFLSYFAGLIERMELRGNRFLEEARDHRKLKIMWKKIFESLSKEVVIQTFYERRLIKQYVQLI